MAQKEKEHTERMSHSESLKSQAQLEAERFEVERISRKLGDVETLQRP